MRLPDLNSRWEKANARADALQARVAELAAALKASNKDGVAEIGAHETTRLMLKRRESELADLRGRVERVMKVYPYFESDLEGTTLAVALEALRNA